MQGSSQILIKHELLSSSEVTGSLLWLTIEWITIYVGIGRILYPLIMTYLSTFLPGTRSRIFRNLHTSMKSPYPLHQLNLTYIEKEISLLWKKILTAGSLPDNWRSWTDAYYTSKFTPSLTTPTYKAPTIKKVTIMATKMNSVKPTTNVLTKDTQVQNNGNCGVRPKKMFPKW